MAAQALAAPTLDELMAAFGFGKDDVQRVRDGEMVKTTTKETSDREIATVMVFLVKAPVKTIISAFEAGMFFHYDPRSKRASRFMETVRSRTSNPSSSSRAETRRPSATSTPRRVAR
jgi:hypothetical protein